jgi:hypothetical protein
MMTAPVHTDEKAASSTISWRDIYRAVAESEVRIVAAINTAVGPLSAASQDHEQRIRRIEVECAKAMDHEQRIRSVELGGSNEAKDASAHVAALALRVAALELEENQLMARERGILATLSAAQKTVLLLAAIGGLVLTMQHILEGLFT